MSQGEVAAKAEAVTHLFDILLPIVPSPDSSTDPALHVSIEYEDQYGRFNIWVGNLGVFADGHASLDYRLRDSPQQMVLLKEVLDELQRLLLQGLLTTYFGLYPSMNFAFYSKSFEKSADPVYHMPSECLAGLTAFVVFWLTRNHNSFERCRGHEHRSSTFESFPSH